LIPESFTVQLSASERDAIFKHVPLTASVAARLRFALHTTKGLEFDLMGDDILDFGEALDQSLSRLKKGADARMIESVLRRMTIGLRAQYPPDDELDFPPDMPQEVREALKELVDTTEFSSPEEMMSALQETLIHADTSPREYLLGLTAAEALHLIQSDWAEPDSALQLDENLSWEELAGSTYCMDAFRFLTLVEKMGGFKLTPKKCLNRASVKLLLEEGCYPGPNWEIISSLAKVVNELDVFPIHMVHMLLLDCRVVRHYKGKLVITKLGREMLQERNAGAIQCAMFHALYQGMELSYLDRLPDFPGLQSSIAFILYAIGQLARQPITAKELREKSLLPGVAEELDMHPGENNWIPSLVFERRILEPLRNFGLVEIALSGERYARDRNLDLVNVTPLFDAMLHFQVKDE
jgi:hypothetical protein